MHYEWNSIDCRMIKQLIWAQELTLQEGGLLKPTQTKRANSVFFLVQLSQKNLTFPINLWGCLLDRVINFVSKLISHPNRVVLWINEIPNLKEFFLYVRWELSSFSFKLTNESASFTQSANSNTTSETLSSCDWLIVWN